MAESQEILFDTILTMQEVKITDVVEKNCIVYFKANGHQFCCAAGRVYHEKAIMYDMPPIKIWAKQEKDPESIIAKEKDNKQFNEDWDDWTEYQDKVIEYVFSKMLPFLLLNETKKAQDLFEFYFDHILPGKGVKKIINQFKKRKQ